MALQTSGAISFADLQTEFGGSNPVSLSEYVRNIGDTSLTGGGNEIRYTSIVDGSTFKLGADTAPANLIFQKHQKLILEVTDANMTFSSNKLYFSTSQTLGNNNLITTGVTNNATATDALMVIDFSNAGFSSSSNGTLVGYLKTDLCSNVTAVYLADTPTTNYVQTHVAEAKFELPSNFSGGDYNQKVSTYRDIGANENISIIPAGGNATMQVTLPGGASGGVWAGGTWSYITINLYDATYSSANGTMTFDNYRQVGWTNNTSYTNGSGNYIGGSGAYSNTASGWASTVASCLNSNSGAPNYQSTSEPVVASASTSGSTLTVTITNNGSNRILWHKYQTNQTGTAKFRPINIGWQNNAGNFEMMYNGGAGGNGEGYNTAATNGATGSGGGAKEAGSATGIAKGYPGVVAGNACTAAGTQGSRSPWQYSPNSYSVGQTGFTGGNGGAFGAAGADGGGQGSVAAGGAAGKYIELAGGISLDNTPSGTLQGTAP